MCLKGRSAQPHSPFGWQRLPTMHIVPLQTQTPEVLHATVPVVPAAQLEAVAHRHEPATQVNPAGHARPHAPQLTASVDVLMQPAGVSQQV